MTATNVLIVKNHKIRLIIYNLVLFYRVTYCKSFNSYTSKQQHLDNNMGNRLLFGIF